MLVSIYILVETLDGFKLGIDKLTDMVSLVNANNNEFLIYAGCKPSIIFINGQTLIILWACAFINVDTLVDIIVVLKLGTVDNVRWDECKK